MRGNFYDTFSAFYKCPSFISVVFVLAWMSVIAAQHSMLRENRGRLKCAIALEFSAHRMRPFIRWSGYSWLNNKVQNCVKMIFDKNADAKICGARLGH